VIQSKDIAPQRSRQQNLVLVVLLMLLSARLCPSVLARFQSEIPVFVTASFTDKNGLFIENLAAEEIQIFENDQPRKLEFLARDEIPAAYGLLFDKAIVPEFMDQERAIPGSLSTATSAKSLAYGLIDKFLGRQILWVGAYDRELQVVLNFNSDAYQAKDAIQRIGGSRKIQDAFLYGAFLPALQALKLRQERRRVLILFIDAVDHDTANSKIRPMRNLISSSNVELFAVSFASRMGSGVGRLPALGSEATLKDLSGLTAGNFYALTQYRDHLEDLVRSMFNHIRTLYTLGFQSTSRADQPSRLVIRCLRTGSKVKHRLTTPNPG
jgi:hypothetical protein